MYVLVNKYVVYVLHAVYKISNKVVNNRYNMINILVILIHIYGGWGLDHKYIYLKSHVNSIAAMNIQRMLVIEVSRAVQA